MVYEPTTGEHIQETAETIVAIAKDSQEIVTARFNDIVLTANPGDTADAIVKFFSDESNRRSDEYVNSSEYKELQRLAEEAWTRADLVLKGALSVSPEKMSLIDEKGWKKFVKANQDGYGSGIISFAELWARLMEGRIANGDTVAGCAEEASHIADTEGITGYMYGVAVEILSQVWKYGEELRQWHNLKTQLGDEGQRANEIGGVLNPALLSIRLDHVEPDEKEPDPTEAVDD